MWAASQFPVLEVPKGLYYLEILPKKHFMDKLLKNIKYAGVNQYKKINWTKQRIQQIITKAK